MQSVGGSLLLQQLVSRAPALNCAAACQRALNECISSLQQTHPVQPHQQQLTAADEQQQQQQQSQWQSLPLAPRHLLQFAQFHPLQLQLLRHYRQPAAYTAAQRPRPPVPRSDDSGSDSDFADLAPRLPARQQRSQQYQQQPRQQQQRQQQQRQQWQRSGRQQYQLQRRGSDDEAEGHGVQQHWRQQWQQQQERQSERQQHGPSGSRRGDQRNSSSSSSSRRGDSHRSSRGHNYDFSHSTDRQHQQHQQQHQDQLQQQKKPASRGQGAKGKAAVDPVGLTTAISAASSLQQLQKLLTDQKEHMQQIHVCAAYKAVVRLSVGLRDKSSAGSKSVADTTEQSVNTRGSGGSSSSGQLVTVDNSMAFDLLRQLSKRMQQQIRVARPWDLAQAAWACSKLQFRDEQLLQSIAQQAQRKAAILTPQDISQLASAYGRLSYPHKELRQLLHGQAVAKAADFAPWALVHTAWALHVCGQDVRGLLEVAVPLLRAEGRVQQLKELDVATLLWLLADYSILDEALLQAAAGHLAASISSYSPSSLANALMACAALGFSTPALSTAATATVLSGLQQSQAKQFRPKQVAHAVFALAKLQACDQQLLDATAAAFRREPQAYWPPLLSMLVWVCVLAKQQVPAGFVQELAQCSRDKLDRFSGDQMTSLLRGLLSMPAHHDLSTVQLLSQAQGLLPQKLPDVSTAVLTELIKSTAKQLKALQQQQHAGIDSQAAAAASAGPADDSISSSTSAGSSWGGSSLTHDDREQMEVVLASMLQECVPAWSAAQRLGQLARWQAVAVAEALEGCGQQDLAGAARQVCQAIEGLAAARSADQQAPAKADDNTPAVPAAPRAAGAAGSWVDSFVASTH